MIQASCSDGAGRRFHFLSRLLPRRLEAVCIENLNPDVVVVVKACLYRELDSAILVVKATEDRLPFDGAAVLNRAMEWGILVQGTMSPRFIIIGGICAQDPAQVRFTECDHVVQAFPADRANESLNVSVLPG